MLKSGTKVRVVSKGFDPDIIGIVVVDDGRTVRINRNMAGLLPDHVAIVEVPSNQVEVY